MIVFKTFFNIMKKNKLMVILYIGLTIFFAGFNMKNNETVSQFSETKPPIYIVNNDKNEGVTKNLIDYLNKSCEVKELENNQNAIDDALFYRQVDYVIYIPQNYGENFLAGKNPQIEIKQTGDYGAELARMKFERYLKVANKQLEKNNNEEELIKNINEIMNKEVDVEIKSSLDTEGMYRLAFYFNFSNYSVLAVSIYVICTVMVIFKSEKISKRTNIGAMSYKKINKQVLFSSIIFGIAVWFLFVVVAIILAGKNMLTINGLMFGISSFIFTLCAISLSVLLGNLINNKNAITGLVNVIGIGSSFLCGCFVPINLLPDFVVKIAHILPSYWFINANNIIGETEIFKGEALKNICIDFAVVIAFTIGFIILTNIISNKKRKIN